MRCLSWSGWDWPWPSGTACWTLNRIDFFKYTKVWYNTVKENGFSAFSQNFSNYNPPYLYLLYLIARFFPDLPGVIATKLPSLLADFILAWFAYRIVRLKYANSPLPLFAAFAVLFAPTIVLNSAFWGQADALYTSALLGAFISCLQKNTARLCFCLAFRYRSKHRLFSYCPCCCTLLEKGNTLEILPILSRS